MAVMEHIFVHFIETNLKSLFMKYLFILLLFFITPFIGYAQKAEWIDFTRDGDVNFKVVFNFFKDSTIIYTLDENDSVISVETNNSKKYIEKKIKDSLGLIYSSNKGSFNKNDFNGLLKFYSENIELPYVVYKFKYGSDKIIQEDYVQNKHEILNGENVEYYKSGKIFIIHNYSSGKLDGEFIEYFESGNIKRKGFYLNGNLNGELFNYYENGQIKSKENYLNGDIFGEWISYYDNGNISSNTLYYKGEKISNNSSFDCDNDFICFSNGYFYDGSQKLYYINGQISSFKNYKNGYLNGEVIFYHPNGGINVIGKFLNGKQSGLFKEFFASGHLEAVRNYRNGDLNGVVNVYYENGKKYLVSNYINGLQNGVQLSFFENGRISSTYNYIRGKKEGVVKTYDSLGNPIFYEFYKNDKLDGLRKFYQNGRLLNQTNYKADKKNGLEIFYSMYGNSGRITRISYFKDGMADGEFKQFYENGKLEKSGFYINNNIHGQWMFYNTYGRLTESQIWNNGQKISTKVFR
jgi:antitoxin component YwqK of YwqJK toxin-antitoxin module